jgi:hypothetical protein
VPDNAFLVTIDATSLYTNIPTTGGISALEHFLNKRPAGSLPRTAFLTELAAKILKNNNFQFMGENYMQISGTAMGTSFAPEYANLYMGRQEQTFLQKQAKQPLMWVRFIDDIFMIWTGTETELLKFLSDLNGHGTLKYTWDYSQQSATFLDVTLKLDEDRKLQTSVHIKPTNKLLYLHNTSCHPKHTKKGIIYSQAVRGKRICTTKEDLDIYLNKIAVAFINQGYDEKLVQKEIGRLKYHKEKTKPKTVASFSTPPLVVPFHPALTGSLHPLLDNAHSILASSNETKDIFTEKANLSYRRAANLGNIVAPKPQPKNLKQKQLGKSGSFPCKNRNRQSRGRNCGGCSLMRPRRCITAPNTNITYQIRGHNTCTTEKVIYLLKCKFCKAHYIGKTLKKFRQRLAGHRSTVREKKLLPVATHALSHKKYTLEQCFEAIVLRSFPADTTDAKIRQTEFAYQAIFQSRAAPGLNIM